jgi:xanthine dehydrogenase accessory factor
MLRVILRGGGDLASGVALRLYRCGMQIVVTELSEPLAVRRMVSFAQAVYSGEIQISEVHSHRASSLEQVEALLAAHQIAVLVDPQAQIRYQWKPDVLVDARMTKLPPDLGVDAAPLVIGLGPGFTAGKDCHAVVETKRGHFLGNVYWNGSAEMDTGRPEPVMNKEQERVLRAPVDGVLVNYKEICSRVEAGEVICAVDQIPLTAQFSGVLRGLLHDGLHVCKGMKIGDLDPRSNGELCSAVSDKALAIGGGVLEAILSQPEMRTRLADGR